MLFSFDSTNPRQSALLRPGNSLCRRLAEIEPHVEFLLKQLRAAMSVSQVFPSIAASVHLQSHRAALKGSADLQHALPLRMIQSLGEPQYRRKSPCDALVRVVQRGTSGVMPSRLRLSIVIAHQCRRHGSVAAF